MAAPKTTATATPAPEVTPEVTVEPTADVVARRFVTTTEDAPPVVAKSSVPKLNPKTLAEQRAGLEALSQYAPASE